MYTDTKVLIMNKSTLLVASIILSSITAFSISAKTEIPKEEMIKLNAIAEVELPANPTTGNLWIIRQLPTEVALVAMDYVQSPDCKKGMVGCGGKSVLHLKGVSKGTGELVLQYARPTGELPAEKHVIKVMVE